MSDTLIIAEKPSVARDIARVVGATLSRPGCLQGNGYTVTWAIGHLVCLPEPGEISPEWKAWRTASLPMLPEEWPLKVVEQTKDQYQTVKRLLRECDNVICATDAGREGELIFRYIYDSAKCKKKVRRLWISSLTPDAIRSGMQSLKDGSRYDSLADAARARSRADWLVGMNLSRAYALTFGDRFFVGRVQTPTLALVIKRDREIAEFKAEDYLEIEATFALESHRYPGFYLGEDGKEDVRPDSAVKSDSRSVSLATPQPKVKRLPPDGKLASEIVARVKGAKASVRSVDSRTLRQPPPLLYDLTELQRHANRLFGFSAARTLELLQALYERHKLISYPRTDSNHLSQSVASTLKEIVDAIRPSYSEDLHPSTGITPLGSRYVDDSKVTDHHAIIPTHVRPHTATLGLEEKKIYDLVCRRLLALWQGDYVTAVTTVITEAKAISLKHFAPTDLFRTQGTVVVEPGWKVLDFGSGKSEGEATGPLLPTGLKKAVLVEVVDAKSIQKTTRPPPFLNDASLLAAMESAGRNLEDRELQLAMRDSGLGTPATRSSIIEALLNRGYLERQGKALRGTELGGRLIDTVHPTVKSAELTGRWERELAQIQAGKRTLTQFMTALHQEIRERVQEVVASEPIAPAQRSSQRKETSYEARAVPQRPPPVALPTLPFRGRGTGALGATPRPLPTPKVMRSRDVKELLEKTFGFPSFRPYQEPVCRAVVEGRDVLLVMPTGAGKSLCYQLPGLARGGTTLVISPLVALIEDQVEKLKRMGLSAERIHSGRKREESRAVCQDYLAGRLDFLFVAPERLAVPGFPEMLKKRPVSLVAIDEAHCISHWGHDFRPDYRLLGERLGDFRPAPVIALTATATPLVQEDIAKQLGLSEGLKSIHGFRRTNIAIQLAELNPSERPEAIVRLLKERDRRPAIVYAPTRKAAEAIAEELKSHFRVEAYHAGMPGASRDRVQERYLKEDLDVIVATIAFGMGIDKANVRTVIHAALPGSVEGYYQEIGRAGRDGKASKAILFHSFVDRKTHEFFFEKSYPERSVLAKIFTELRKKPVAKATLRAKFRTMEEEVFDRALEKLWIHKGAIIDPDENVVRGEEEWEVPYAEQREHRLHQLQQMISFTDSVKCRMVGLVSHFGDDNDSGNPCGLCDNCRPGQSESLVPIHVASEGEQKVAAKIMAAVSARSGYPVGRLYQDFSDSGDTVPRRDFELIVTALTAEGWLEVIHETFQKEGKTIAFRKLVVTELGETAGSQELCGLKIKGLASEAKPSRKKTRKPKATRQKKKKSSRKSASRSSSAPSSGLWEALREWRLQEARKKKVPAFRVLTDAVLKEICDTQPETELDLLEIKGIGPALATRYGSKVLALVQSHG